MQRAVFTSRPRTASRRQRESAAASVDVAGRVGDASVPPFFVWHTAEDLYVPPEHTYRLAAAPAANNVALAVHVFMHGPHSLGLAHGAGEAAIWTMLAEAWIHEQVRAGLVGGLGR